MRTWSILLCICMSLAGCAAVAPVPSSQVAALLDDSAFPAPARVPDASSLFALSPAMQAHLQSRAFQAKLRQGGAAHGLLNALYDKSDLQLEYESSITRTAAETYERRSGNCLSLVIMTAAFARELGMPVRFQSVITDTTWNRASSLYLVSDHVNITLAPPITTSGRTTESELTVDFLAPRDAGKLPTRELTEQNIVALYLNNRAVEELVQGRSADAYWWARAALQASPTTVAPYNTLAVVYERSGRPLLAERVYRAALERRPDNVVVMQNLVPLLAANGKAAESQALAERLARLYPAPPYHYFNQGMAAYKAGRYDQARTLFAREVLRAPYNDEFHFWLGVANLQLGELAGAEKQLALARDTSTRADQRQRYSSKLAHLRGIAGSTRRN